jgi:hypothetical protein
MGGQAAAKIDLKEVGCEGANWTQLAQDIVQWQNSENADSEPSNHLFFSPKQLNHNRRSAQSLPYIRWLRSTGPKYIHPEDVICDVFRNVEQHPILNATHTRKAMF